MLIIGLGIAIVVIACRFPPPWTVEELEACFVVRANCSDGASGAIQLIEFFVVDGFKMERSDTASAGRAADGGRRRL